MFNNIKAKTAACLLVAASFVMSSCASVVHDSHQPVTISTIPAGATIYIDSQTYMTPANLSLKGKSEYPFTISKPGYKTVQGKIDSDFRVWTVVLGNIANLTGLIGIGVDVLGTGAAYELQKNQTVTLQPDVAAAMPQPAGMPLGTAVAAPFGQPVPAAAPIPAAAPAPQPAGAYVPLNPPAANR